MSFPGSNSEAIHAVVSLGPPTIENGTIQSAVQHDFLTARARSFEGAARIVEPYVHALHEMPADIDVVVLDKDKFLAELGIAHQLRNLLQHALARLIERMRLTGKHELDGTVGIVHHRR